MKNISVPLVDEYLKSVQGIQPAGTVDFFYTRLRAKMEKDKTGAEWSFPLRPVWVVGSMVLLLMINILMLSQQHPAKETITSNKSSLQNFARAYDQVIPSY